MIGLAKSLWRVALYRKSDLAWERVLAAAEQFDPVALDTAIADPDRHRCSLEYYRLVEWIDRCTDAGVSTFQVTLPDPWR